MIPDLSVLVIIFSVLLLAGLLNALLFKPLLAVMAKREAALNSARALADESAARAEAATADFEARTTAARAQVYREMEEVRRVALARRAELLADTRKEAEAEIGAATAQLRAEADRARQSLAQEAEALGGAIVERVLGRKAS